MAKKIKLNFSKVEERSGFNTKEVPEGLHRMKVVSADVGEAKDGTDMVTYGLKPVDPRYKTRLFPYYCKLQENQYFKIRDLLVAVGIKVPKSVFNFDPDAPVGKEVAAEVSDEANPQYAGRSTIDGIYGLDILDDEDGVEPEDDEEEEEDEVDEEEEVEEDDDLQAELEGLTLPELRKRAKGLGIDTAGVKKDELIEAIIEEELGEEADDEEEDLDDEELEDEELEDEEFDDEEEDEEEEPEPAPRRRPAAKKAAPAAKAAPARRTVKRR
jgi:hypothetical protein